MIRYSKSAALAAMTVACLSAGTSVFAAEPLWAQHAPYPIVRGDNSQYQQGLDSALRGYQPQPQQAVVYPNLDASLYPCPRPNIPAYVGGTQITNSAFYPHEMLYPHRYRALYPPFYYKVKWRYTNTPFGVSPLNAFGLLPWPGHYYDRARVSQKVELVGTKVDVKYHGSISPFTLFFPPN